MEIPPIHSVLLPSAYPGYCLKITVEYQPEPVYVMRDPQTPTKYGNHRDVTYTPAKYEDISPEKYHNVGDHTVVSKVTEPFDLYKDPTPGPSRALDDLLTRATEDLNDEDLFNWLPLDMAKFQVNPDPDAYNNVMGTDKAPAAAKTIAKKEEEVRKPLATINARSIQARFTKNIKMCEAIPLHNQGKGKKITRTPATRTRKPRITIAQRRKMEKEAKQLKEKENQDKKEKEEQKKKQQQEEQEKENKESAATVSKRSNKDTEADITDLQKKHPGMTVHRKNSESTFLKLEDEYAKKRHWDDHMEQLRDKRRKIDNVLATLTELFPRGTPSDDLKESLQHYREAEPYDPQDPKHRD